MAVDEQIAGAWWRLTGGVESVPDPSLDPWAWVRALTGAGYVVTFDEAQVVISRPELGLRYEVDVNEGDALETALEAAIRAWAKGARRDLFNGKALVGRFEWQRCECECHSWFGEDRDG